MTRLPPTRMPARQRGVGLIELMIGLTAGLVLIGALASFFVGSRQLNRTHDDVSRMQESGRIALEIMGRAIRQAGARSSAVAAFTGTALTATEGGSNADSITVQYAAQDGGETDCGGSLVAAGATVTYVFFVDTTTPVPTLKCTNGTGATEVMMDNIENMQITYGLDAARDGTIDNAYQTAAGAVPTAAAVRVSLLIRGPTPLVAAGGPQTYDYNGTTVTATDRYLRQVFTATFTVRNQAG